MYQIEGIVAVFNFHRQGKKIQVIGTAHTPMQAIMRFHSSESQTCVDNGVL
jgi:hypothetical protein